MPSRKAESGLWLTSSTDNCASLTLPNSAWQKEYANQGLGEFADCGWVELRKSGGNGSWHIPFSTSIYWPLLCVEAYGPFS